MMLRVQRERMNDSFFPSEREYARRYGLDVGADAPAARARDRHAPRSDEPGHGDRARGGRLARSTIVEQVTNGVSRPDGRAVPAARGEREVSDLFLIKGARLSGRRADRPAAARRQSFAEIGRGLSAPGAEVVDADGLVALPGLVDLHTHLREPGREDAETVETGSRAAALGGYTAVCAMANTSPVADTAGVVEQVWRLGPRGRTGRRAADRRGHRRPGRRAPGRDSGAMADSAARVRIFSDDGHCVADPRLMRRALEYVKAFDGVIAQHAEEPRLTAGAQMQRVSLRPAGPDRLAGGGRGGDHRPGCAAGRARRGAAARLPRLDRRQRRDHASGQGAGRRVTAEVTPHHLLLTDERAAGYDPVFKVNPPLRTAADVAALRAALVDGTIDARRHRPRPARRRGQGVRVGVRPAGHARVWRPPCRS